MLKKVLQVLNYCFFNYVFSEIIKVFYLYLFLPAPDFSWKISKKPRLENALFLYIGGALKAFCSTKSKKNGKLNQNGKAKSCEQNFWPHCFLSHTHTARELCLFLVDHFLYLSILTHCIIPSILLKPKRKNLGIM